jgi:hypothetical protein
LIQQEQSPFLKDGLGAGLSSYPLAILFFPSIEDGTWEVVQISALAFNHMLMKKDFPMTYSKTGIHSIESRG